MYRFASCEVDVPRRELRRAGELMHLEPQAFDLLVVLLERREEVVAKIDLLDGVWGHRFLSEANLTTRVKEVRRAVGDDGTLQHIVRNVRGRGYRLIAPVEVVGPTAPLRPPSERGLIGRDDDVLELVDLLARSQLVTLIGPGGVGKSALARAVSKRNTTRYPLGVYVVELAALDSGEHVLAEVARALAVVLDHNQPDDTIRLIARLDALVVLDNCEHVVDHAGVFLDRLMSIADARVRVLATSRVRLGLSNEVVATVGTLCAERALELFDTRAVSVQPSWNPDEIGRERVDSLLAGLDRLPLTIEMAAARLGSMTFDELEAALGQGMPLLQVTHRSPARRHRTLDSLVAWSADLVDPAVRQIFTEFSVFASAVGATDAGAVLLPDSPAAVVFELASLAEQSLLVADLGRTATSYRMLATVRAVAGRWLEDSGTANEVRRRHAEHFAGVVMEIDQKIRTPQELEGRQRLEGIVAEVRAAHHWAQGHDPALAAEMSGALHLSAYSTFWNEPAEWSKALLTRYPDAGEDALLGARLIVAGVAANRGDLAYAHAVAASAVERCDQQLHLTALEILADIGIYQGDLAAVAEWTDELHRLGSDLGDQHAVAIAAVDAALALVFGGNSDGAFERLEVLNLTSLAPSDLAWVTYTRGEALSSAGDPSAAAAFANAIELARSVGNPFVISVAQVSLASEHARAEAYPQALDAFAGCLHDYVRHGNFVHAVTALRKLAAVLVAIGDDRAATILGAASSNERLRPSYGPEAALLAEVLTGVERRVGANRFGEWSVEGRALDLNQAVRVAAELVERHRG